MKLKRISLTARTLMLTNSIVLLGMLVLAFSLAHTMRSSAQRSLAEKISSSADLTSAPAREFIWNFDIAGLQALADQLASQGEIKAADFLDKNEKSMVKPAEFTSDLTIFKKELHKDNALAGYLVLGYSSAGIEAEIWRSLKWVLMISLLVQISVSLSLWIFLSRSSGRIEESVNVLKETAGKTMEAGFNFSKISGDLLGRGEVQAAAVEETTATLAEIAAMVTMSARNAKAAQTESEASFKSAELGQKSILELNASIKEVVLATKKIAEVTEAVDDIAFQINLLSLNASVEAARAGEQGRGFAVVAEGVRTLAFKSAQAAKDIEQIINQSTDKALHAQKSAETNTGILNELLISIEKVKQLNAEIAESSHEQALGVDSISKAMGEIDTKTNEAAMASREANDHAQDLTAESEKLGNVIQTFEDEILGKRSA